MKALKVGTQTSSLINHVMSAGKDTAPEVGMGATILMWSDRHAATIVEVTKKGKRVAIIKDIATRTDDNGMSDNQTYEYKPGEDRGTNRQYFTLRKNGAWVREGESMKGQRISIGHRSSYYDHSF